MTTARSGCEVTEASVPADSFSVLIVDDNAAKRLALKAALWPLGCPVVEADSGLAALRCVLAADFAVILLDVRMPGMDGFETAARIRQRRQSECTPIIFITAFGSDELIPADGYAEGAVDFMFAPVEPGVLRAKVSAFGELFKRSTLLITAVQQSDFSTARLRALVDALPIGIFETDAHDCYTYTNLRWSEITGVPAEEAIGQELGTLDTRVDVVQQSEIQGEIGPRGQKPRRGHPQVRGDPARRDAAACHCHGGARSRRQWWTVGVGGDGRRRHQRARQPGR